MHAIPGNPWSNYSNSPRALLGLNMDKSLQDQLNQHFGLDLPLWRQYTRYIIGDLDKDGNFFCGAICGNLGPSIQQRGRSVWHILFVPPEGKTFRDSRFGYSIRLVLFGSLIAVGFGVLLGILSVTKAKGTRSSISVGLAALISIPNFVLGLFDDHRAGIWTQDHESPAGLEYPQQLDRARDCVGDNADGKHRESNASLPAKYYE